MKKFRWLLLSGIAVIVILAFVTSNIRSAIRVYDSRVNQAKEVTLLQDLIAMRRAIDYYTVDHKRAPQSLQQLVQTGYLRSIPVDPFTQSAETWIVETEREPFTSGVPVGISDVISGAEGTDQDGKPYRKY